MSWAGFDRLNHIADYERAILTTQPLRLLYVQLILLLLLSFMFEFPDLSLA